MDEERICSECGEPIDENDEDAVYLENDEVWVCASCAEDCCFTCALCGETFSVNDAAEDFELSDGSRICTYCFAEDYFTCDICGEIAPVENSAYWGDARICPDCLAERCPSFDEEENLREIAEAYEAFKARYLGRTVAEEFRGQQVTVNWQVSDDTDIDYELTVTVDDEGRIADVSRIQAEILLAEGITSSDRRPYAVDDSDYDTAGDEIEEQLQLDP